MENPVSHGLDSGPIYLDYNGPTPVDPRVTEAALPFLTTHFGNPASSHWYADEPLRALAQARTQLAQLIGADASEIVFTSGGSEADALAIHGVALARHPADAHVITQVTEHPAVLECCRALQRRYGTEVSFLPVDREGRVDPRDLADAITTRTALVSIMTANNETGVLQPVSELARIAHDHGALFHTDAAQAVGKIPVSVNDVDLLSIAGHKLYAPKGIGALYVRPDVPLEPIVPGGGQERGLRAGTENVALTVALGTAAELARIDLAGSQRRLSRLRDLLYDNLEARLPERLHLNGHPDHRLPNTLNIGIKGLQGQDLLTMIPEIAAATGSACHSGAPEPSPVLSAMGQPADRALSALRLSLGRWTTRDDVTEASNLIAEAAKRLLSKTIETR
ncbi:cysteine desulfurase [Actinomadura alba]|uniref:cysteine desulfurase n=1 Tax=Actinomadura alba TaxID=406431 RepID=A0ABR7LZQ9_9ACTN|nr:cysteine desulfurase [Actinomadura alba]